MRAHISATTCFISTVFAVAPTAYATYRALYRITQKLCFITRQLWESEWLGLNGLNYCFGTMWKCLKRIVFRFVCSLLTITFRCSHNNSAA